MDDQLEIPNPAEVGMQSVHPDASNYGPVAADQRPRGDRPAEHPDLRLLRRPGPGTGLSFQRLQVGQTDQASNNCWPRCSVDVKHRPGLNLCPGGAVHVCTVRTLDLWPGFR